MIKPKKTFVKITYKILTVILCLFWCFFAITGFTTCITKTYLYPLKNKQTVFDFADKYDLDRALIFAVIKVESGFDKNALSQAGAIGLMQLTPDTAEYIATLQGVKTYDLYNERTNINFGCFYIKYLTSKFNNMDTAIIAYNAGEGNVRLWLNNPKYSDDKVTLKNIPFQESREYIKKIKYSFAKYKKLYRNILDK